MKCNHCGSNQPDNAKFCSYCGERIDNFYKQPYKNMAEEFQANEQDENSEKEQNNTFNQTKKPEHENNFKFDYSFSDNVNETAHSFNDNKKTENFFSLSFKKIKTEFSAIWKKLDRFCKTAFVFFCIGSLLLIVAVLAKRTLPIVFSTLQVGGLSIAVLLHRGKIKINCDWLKYAILIASIFLTFVSYSSF